MTDAHTAGDDAALRRTGIMALIAMMKDDVWIGQRGGYERLGKARLTRLSSGYSARISTSGINVRHPCSSLSPAKPEVSSR